MIQYNFSHSTLFCCLHRVNTFWLLILKLRSFSLSALSLLFLPLFTLHPLALIYSFICSSHSAPYPGRLTCMGNKCIKRSFYPLVSILQGVCCKRSEGGQRGQCVQIPASLPARSAHVGLLLDYRSGVLVK